jgi:transcriptional regulator with XRE-family HTH domain
MALLGERIKRLRVGAKKTMRAFSIETGIGAETVWKYETGKIEDPGVHNFHKMAKSFGISMDELYLGSKKSLRPPKK